MYVYVAEMKMKQPPSRLSATMPAHEFKAKELKRAKRSKQKNNILLTAEEKAARGYLEAAEEFYKYGTPLCWNNSKSV